MTHSSFLNEITPGLANFIKLRIKGNIDANDKSLAEMILRLMAFMSMTLISIFT